MPILSTRTRSSKSVREKFQKRLHVYGNELTSTAQGAQGEVVLPVRHNSRIIKESIRRVLSLDELRLALAISAREPNLRDLHDLMTIISTTGIRPGELRELRWTDVDSIRRRVVIGKNSKSGYLRYVPFGRRTYQMLEGRRERGPDMEYVFGKSPRAFLVRCSRQLWKVSETIGVEHISLRALRNTFFVRWVQSGKSLDALCLISGHRLRQVEVHLSWEDRLAIAARDQAKLEEEL